MWRWLKRDEDGQSLVELTVVSVVLILTVVIVFEAGVVFSSYITLLNASREGAMYASSHPELVTLATTDDVYQKYEGVINAEARLRLFINDEHVLHVNRPQVGSTVSFGSPITVSVSYDCYTFTSGLSLPFFGRFGLPPYWPISAWTVMPIR
jgi:Flp pilus assembly protein TadG